MISMYLYRLIRKINKLLIDRLCYYILIVFLIVVNIIVLLQISLRVIFQSSLPWTGELSKYILVYMGSFGAVIAFRKGIHIEIGIFANIFKNKYKKFVKILYLIIMTIFSIIIIIYGINFASVMKTQISASVKISMWWIYLAFPLGSIFILFHIFEVLLNAVKDKFH